MLFFRFQVILGCLTLYLWFNDNFKRLIDTKRVRLTNLKRTYSGGLGVEEDGDGISLVRVDRVIGFWSEIREKYH